MDTKTANKKKIGISDIQVNVNRRFFECIDTLMKSKKLQSFYEFCQNEDHISMGRYYEMKTEFGADTEIRPSRYKTIEMEAIHKLVTEYNVNARWLITGIGEMFD